MQDLALVTYSSTNQATDSDTITPVVMSTFVSGELVLSSLTGHSGSGSELYLMFLLSSVPSHDHFGKKLKLTPLIVR
jgi:ABC-type Mn2+/Zn2+ transport system permease subunit